MNMKNTHETSATILRKYQDMILENQEEVDEAKDEELDENQEEVDESKDEEEVDEGIKRTPDPQIGKGVGKYSGNPEMEKDLASVGLQKPMARATARGRMHGAKQPKHGGTGFGG